MSNFKTWWTEGRPIIPDRWCRGEADKLNWLGRALNAYHHGTRWIHLEWWGWVLGRRKEPNSGVSWGKTAWCRATGHRGIIYWNPGGLEPDNHCRGCGEEIG